LTRPPCSPSCRAASETLPRCLHCERAQEYKREVRKWCRSHPKNRYRLESEVARAIRLLSATPRAGEESADPDMPDVRRVVLQKSEFLLDYFVFDEQRRVELLSLWYAPRGERPKLLVIRSR
jgi:hypothetical protein